MRTYRDRGGNGNDVALLDQKLSRFVADFANLGFGYGSTCAELRNRPGLIVRNLEGWKG